MESKKGFSHIEALVIFVVFAIFGLGAYVWWSNYTTPTGIVSHKELVPALQTDLLREDPQADTAQPAPQLDFKNYELAEETALPALPKKVPIYSFNPTQGNPQIAQAPQQLNLKPDPTLSSANFDVYTNTQSPQNLGLWVTNRQNGSFEFRSFGSHRPASIDPSAAPKEVATTFLKETGLWDETLTATATYHHAETPFTYVEFHRDWKKIGLPIVNPLGLAAIPAEQSIAKLQVGQADFMPTNPLIGGTSDGSDSQKRPNTFNTLTVAVTPDGYVFSATSNLRPLEKTDQLSSNQLKTPQEALAELKQHQGLFGLTLPIGEGTVEFKNVYPQNKASAGLAQIKDLSLAYIEKHHPIRQDYLQPVYVFRGTALLDSGYTVNWTETIPAVKGVSGVASGKLNSSDLISEVRAETKAFPEIAELFVPGLLRFVPCRPQKSTWGDYPRPYDWCLEALSEEGAQMTMDAAIRKFFDLIGKQWEINVARELIDGPALMSQAQAATTIEDFNAIFAQINGTANVIPNPDCPGMYSPQDLSELLPHKAPMRTSSNAPRCVQMNSYVNTVADNVAASTLQAIHPPTPTPTPTPVASPTPSPALFEPLSSKNPALQSLAEKEDLFPERTKPYLAVFFKISTWWWDPIVGWEAPLGGGPLRRFSGVSPTIFVYHAPDNLSIRLPRGKLTYREPLIDDRLYYEFDPAKAKLEARELLGIIRRGELAGLTQKSARAWGLTPPETRALEVDLKRTAAKVDSDYLKIELATRESLDRELPLKISPAPENVARVHLLVSEGTEGEEGLERQGPRPLERNGFSIVEIGASPRF